MGRWETSVSGHYYNALIFVFSHKFQICIKLKGYIYAAYQKLACIFLSGLVDEYYSREAASK